MSMASREDVWMMQARAMKEDELQSKVIGLAKQLRWRWFHPPRAVNEKIEAGFLDLTMLKAGRCVVAELKQQAKYPTPEQRAWMDDWALVAGVEVHLWRPYDLICGRVAAVLRGVEFQEPLPVSGRDGGLTRART